MNAIQALRKGLDTAMQLMPLIVVVLVFNLISGGILLGVMGINPDAEQVSNVAGVVVLVLGIMMLLWTFIEGGIFSCIQSQIKSGQTQIDSLAQNGMKFFGRLVGISVLGGVIEILLWFVGALLTGLIVSLGGGNNPFFNAVGAIIMGLSVLIAILVSVPLLTGHYIVVTEDGGVFHSLKKGFILFKNYLGRIFLLFLLLGILFILLSSIVNLISMGLGKIGGPATLVAVINLILTSLLNAAIGIFSSSAIMNMVLSLTQDDVEQAAPAAVEIEQPADEA